MACPSAKISVIKKLSVLTRKYTCDSVCEKASCESIYTVWAFFGKIYNHDKNYAY